ncbi:MAG: arylsulfatase [Solirubrobacteraceae bacterium]
MTAVDIRDQPPLAPAYPVQAPEGAPNVVVVLLDDMGFGASSAFGGPCEMPAADRLAAGGLRYTRFHTTAICSATRAALLTGRNHHSVGFGHVAEFAVAGPGYNCRLPRSAATIARVLTGNGYATGAFGKMHETPYAEVTPVGPFDHWPTKGEGFERFYGFIGGMMNHWYPALYDGTTRVEPPRTPEEGYHLSEDLIDKAIDWVNDVRMVTPERPFFCYLPFGATHSPFHVWREWAEKYRGRFDHGWDEQRERTLERQKELGVVPAETELALWVPTVPHWESLSKDERQAACALMELYAGFAEHTDAQVGRFVDALSELGALDNTLIFYILGDNGASSEGGLIGTTNEHAGYSGIRVPAEDILAVGDGLGGPETFPHYPVGWALAMDTPYAWMKQIASHYGGTRNGMIVHWPAGIEDRGALRQQWHHVIDIAPTILEAAGIPAPAIVDGAEQQPVEGTSLAYSFNDAGAEERHTTQYFEIAGSRGIYHDGWVACTVHRHVPWDAAVPIEVPLRDDRWELYDTSTDWSEARDLAAEHQDKLEELKDLFLVEAARHQVLPIDDRSFVARRNASGERGRLIESMTFHGKTRWIPPDAMPNTLGKSHTVSATVVVTDAPAEGVICAQGGRFGGWTLYCKDGTLTYCHNVGDVVRSYVRAAELLAPGAQNLRYEFASEEGLGAGGIGTLFVDNREVGRGRIEQTVAFLFPHGEDFTVGADPSTPVTDEYTAGENAFNGTVDLVRIDLGEGHGITEEDRLRIIMATQ